MPEREWAFREHRRWRRVCNRAGQNTLHVVFKIDKKHHMLYFWVFWVSERNCNPAVWGEGWVGKEEISSNFSWNCGFRTGEGGFFAEIEIILNKIRRVALTGSGVARKPKQIEKHTQTNHYRP